jgi:glycogen(starch) synthase
VRVALLSRAAHPLHPPGGLERAVYHLASHLQKRGVETILVTRPPTGREAFPGETRFVEYGSVGFRHGSVADRALLYPSFAKRLGEEAARLVQEGRVDLVHAQGLTALGYGRRRAESPSLKAPLVMNPQGMEEHKATGLKGLLLGRVKRLSREAARLSDRVIATDEATRGEVEDLLLVPPPKIAVLPNGIDPEELARLTPDDPRGVLGRVLPSLRESSPLFVSVGRLEAYKGFSDILEAMARVAGRLPEGWAWAVVGNGPERAALESRVQGLPPLRSRVHFLGGVEDALLHTLYASADVFVHATRYEGSSLVTLEAMAHGLPVVATRAGGIPDKVVDQETGFLVEPGNVGELADALVRLGGDPGMRRTFGERGKARALRDFSWGELARRTVCLYDELLAAVSE